MPNIIKRLAEDAMSVESPNFKAQELLVKAAGMIETGAKIQINNQQVTNQLIPQAQLPQLDFSLGNVDGEIVNDQLPQGDVASPRQLGSASFLDVVDQSDVKDFMEAEMVENALKELGN